MNRNELALYLHEFLQANNFKDYAPNGLQVEGSEEIRHIVTGVSANAALIEEAIKRGADTIIVHHGWFWKNENPAIIGIKKERIAALLKHNINLFGFHLPLDAHKEIGNNAQLAKAFDWQIEGYFGDDNLGVFGSLKTPLPLQKLAQKIEQGLKRKPFIIGDLDKEIKTIAWCSGGAQSWFEAATNLKVDAYLSGEIAEYNVHLARETGVAYIAAGHHATERFGIAALTEHLAQKFAQKLAIKCEFVDIENPV